MKMRSKSWSSRQFVVLLFLPVIPVALLGGVLLMQTRAWTTEEATTNAADSARIVADMAIGPLMTVEDFEWTTIDVDRQDELDAALHGFVGDDLVRIKIWDANGRVVYSDDRNAVGVTHNISHELADALDGEISSEVSHLGGSENATEGSYDRLLEVYVPLRVGSDDAVVGAFELYLPYEPIGARIDKDTRRIVTILGVALVLLYMALLRVSVDWTRDRKRAEDKDFEANHDPLTGLPNRRMFQSTLEQIAREGGDKLVAVMYIDLDDFKTVNDTLGHSAGDELLKAVAGRLRGVVRSDTTVARLGGDEFAVIVPNVDDPDQPAAIAARLIGCLNPPIRLADGQVKVQASIGIDVANADVLDADDVQRNADNAMYMAKGAGKARHATFDPTLHARLHENVGQRRFTGSSTTVTIDENDQQDENEPAELSATGVGAS